MYCMIITCQVRSYDSNSQRSIPQEKSSCRGYGSYIYQNKDPVQGNENNFNDSRQAHLKEGFD